MRFMRPFVPFLIAAWAFASPHYLWAQELQPRAYVPAPLGINALNTTYSYRTGDVDFDPSLPVEDASAQLHLSTVGYFRSLGVFGRSANLGLTLPFVIGDLSGIVDGNLIAVHRAGIGDPVARFAVNLVGGPALPAKEFARHRSKTKLGASVTLAIPLGQYGSSKIINIGTNRWSFKPEIGFIQQFGQHWELELDAGAWLFTDNTSYLGKTRHQQPIGSGQLHVIYNFVPRLWLSFDGNFYSGGRTSVNGVFQANLQRNSRMGGTLAIPLAKRHTLKVALSRGAYTTIGAAFTSIDMAYQYAWGGGF